MNLPFWFWVVLAAMSLLSMLWGHLVLRDIDHETESQLWIVGDHHKDMVFTTKLKWFRALYFIFITGGSLLLLVGALFL